VEEPITESGRAATQPFIGKVYRDETDRSFVILSINNDQVLMEFADGAIKRVSMRQWVEIKPRPALY